jgi:radical SAM-linked protein
MPRALFEKTGNAIYISHLDLMRVFQRAFKRAGLPLTHTQGFSPRPSVSIALPMSVGLESCCELLDFDLDGEQIPGEEIMARLNEALIEGVRVRSVYDGNDKIRDIAFLDCSVFLEYDNGITPEGKDELIRLFSQPSVVVEKRGKNGMTQQDIIGLIKKMEIAAVDGKTLRLDARICCQNPALNPMQITAAIERYLPQLKPDFARFCRNEIYRHDESIFR